MSETAMKRIVLNDFSALHLLFGNLDENIKNN